MPGDALSMSCPDPIEYCHFLPGHPRLPRFLTARPNSTYTLRHTMKENSQFGYVHAINS
jgi:hypothetical protein